MIENRGVSFERLVTMVILIIQLAIVSSQVKAESSADETVHTVVENLLKRLREEGAGIKDDVPRLDALARELVLPYFDFTKMSQRALGRHWPEFAPPQQQRFIVAFETLMIRNYARTIAEYRDASVKYFPSRELSEGLQKIRVEVTKPAAKVPAQLEFVLRRAAGSWRALEVIVNGVSLVVSYRAGFDTDIGHLGVDGLIAQIETHNAQK